MYGIFYVMVTSSETREVSGVQSYVSLVPSGAFNVSSVTRRLGREGRTPRTARAATAAGLSFMPCPPTPLTSGRGAGIPPLPDWQVPIGVWWARPREANSEGCSPTVAGRAAAPACSRDQHRASLSDEVNVTDIVPRTCWWERTRGFAILLRVAAAWTKQERSPSPGCIVADLVGAGAVALPSSHGHLDRRQCSCEHSVEGCDCRPQLGQREGRIGGGRVVRCRRHRHWSGKEGRGNWGGYSSPYLLHSGESPVLGHPCCGMAPIVTEWGVSETIHSPFPCSFRRRDEEACEGRRAGMVNHNRQRSTPIFRDNQSRPR